MRTILLTAILACFFGIANSQVINTGFESWTSGSPDGWVGTATNIGATNIVQYTSNPQSGTSSVQLVNTGTTHKRFSSQGVSVTSGEVYTVSFYVRGHGDIRTGIKKGATGSYGTYNSYLTINSNAWTKYSQTIVIDSTSASAEFIFSVKATNADIDHLQLDSVKVATAAAATEYPIYDLQYTTDASGNSPYFGQVIITSGTVTAVRSGGFYIQDAPGAWNGMYVYTSTFVPALGDSVKFTAQVDEYNSLTELKSVASTSTISSGNTLPDPLVLTTTNFKNEQNESVLVRLENVNCVNANAGYGMWTVGNGSDTIHVDDVMIAFTPTAGVHYNIVGIVDYSFGEWKLLPRTAADITVYTGINENDKVRFNVYPNPATDVINISNASSLTQITVYDILGNAVLNISKPAQQINVSSLTDGIYQVVFTDENGNKSVSKLIKK